MNTGKSKEDPKTGLAVIIMKEGEVLLGQRKNSVGDGTWGFPGGKVDYYETNGACGVREVKEETGLDIELTDHSGVATTKNYFSSEDLYYITIFMQAKYVSGKPKVMELDKCGTWAWFDWNYLPQPLFSPVKNLIKQGYNPFE